RTSVHGSILVRRTGYNAEFRRQNYFFAPSLDRFSYFDFRIAIDIGGIEEIDAQVQRVTDQRDRIVFAFRAAGVYIGDADAHATKSNRRHVEAAIAEYAFFHGSLCG